MRRLRAVIVWVLLTGSFWPAAIVLAAAQLPPPASAQLADDPEDPKGTVMSLDWQAPTHIPDGWRLAGYRIWLACDDRRCSLERVLLDPSTTKAKIEGLDPLRSYRAMVQAIYAPAGAGLVVGAATPPEVPLRFSHPAQGGPASPAGALYDPSKTNVLVGTVVLSAIVLLTLHYARRRAFYIRPIAGLQAVDDAIGRATEMGRPMLYVSGLGGVGSISTIAAMLILGHVARKTAPYDTPILVPCNDPLVMSVEREIVREAYLEAGRPDAFRPDLIFYTTDSQFGYVAAVDGIIMRERPAANLYMGTFFAEALILGETGNIAGCMQIAGTDADTQLPFFITSCDYTLMGEELYAASAYLSRHPVLVAQLKGQDIGKSLLALILILGLGLATFGQLCGVPSLYELVRKLLAG